MVNKKILLGFLSKVIYKVRDGLACSLKMEAVFLQLVPFFLCKCGVTFFSIQLCGFYLVFVVYVLV